MFNKTTILKFTKLFLFLIIFHFLFTTFVKFQLGVDLHLGFLNSNFINLWKDFYLLMLYILILGYAYKQGSLLENINKHKKMYILFVILVGLSFLVSILHYQGIKTIFIGFKYDFWFLLPILFFSLLDIDKKDIKNMSNYLVGLIKMVVVLSVIYAVVRFVAPEILYLFGYGDIGDRKEGAKPPLLYLTGQYGVQRLSGLFSGPNHMAFYFIAFFPFVLFSYLKKTVSFYWFILFLFLLIGTLSRSAVIALFAEIMIISVFLYVYYKQYRKFIKTLFVYGTLLFVLLSGYLFVSGKYKNIILRGSSTKGHYDRSVSTIKAIVKKPITGYGLGTAGPAAYYSKVQIIPESWFLQIFYELGVVVGLLWFIYIFYLLFLLKKNIHISYPFMDYDSLLSVSLIIGIIGLLVQGLVLHSFEDAMVVLPLFVLVGILLAYNHNNVKKN